MKRGTLLVGLVAGLIGFNTLCGQAMAKTQEHKAGSKVELSSHQVSKHKKDQHKDNKHKDSKHKDPAVVNAEREITIKLTPPVLVDEDNVRAVRFSKSADKVRVVFDLPETVTYKLVEGKDKTTVYFSKPFVATQPEVIDVGDDSVSQIKVNNRDQDSEVDIITPGTVVVSKGELKNPRRLYLDFNKDYEYSVTKEIMPGLTRIDVYSRHHGVSQAGHMLEVDPKLYELRPILGGNSYLGKNTVQNMVNNAGAIGGINASYFGGSKDIYGVTKINGEVVSTFYVPRTALVITGDNKAKIEKISHYAEVVSKLGNYTVAGINSTRSKNGLTLYNNFYGTQTPAGKDVVELVLDHNKVEQVKNGGGTVIEPGKVVLSATGDYLPGFSQFTPGEEITIEQHFSGDGATAKHILGVGPTLVHNGMVSLSTAEEKIGGDVSYGRAPRSGVAILKNGNILLAEVDGRQGGAKGMTLNEFANLLINMTAVEAMNFDGGGSSEIVLQGQTMNTPSDGASRYVATALGVFPLSK